MLFFAAVNVMLFGDSTRMRAPALTARAVWKVALLVGCTIVLVVVVKYTGYGELRMLGRHLLRNLARHLR